MGWTFLVRPTLSLLQLVLKTVEMVLPTEELNGEGGYIDPNGRG